MTAKQREFIDMLMTIAAHEIVTSETMTEHSIILELEDLCCKYRELFPRKNMEH